jgi:tyrosine-protein kinase Etk/Wzc
MVKPKIPTMKTFILRNKIVFTICVLLSLATATVWIYISETTYRAESLIKIEGTNGVADVNAVAAEFTSRNFIADALTGKGLNVEYFINTDFRTVSAKYASPYSVTFRSDNTGFHSRDYTINIHGKESFTLRRMEYGMEKIITGDLGKEINDRNVFITINLKENSKPGNSILKGPDYSFSIYSDDALADMFFTSKNKINATAENGLINLSCNHTSSITSKIIVDALIANYSKSQKVVYDQSVLESVSHIDNQIETVAKQLDVSQNDIAEFKSEKDLLDITNNSKVTLNELSQLQMQKIELDLQMAALDNISMYLRNNRTINNSMVDYGTITDPLFTENISLLSTRYRERSEMKRNSQDTGTIDSEIELLKESIAESVLNTRKKTYVKKQEIAFAIKRLKATMRTYPQAERQMAAMDRKLEMDRKVYDRLVEKRADAIIHTTVPAVTIKILQPSITPVDPYSPKIPQTAGMALFIGLLAASTIGWMRKDTPVKIKTRNEIEAETTIPFIGNIFTTEKGSVSKATPFMDMCTRLLMKNNTDNCQVLTVTSTLQGEGKTFIATNIAKAMASIDKKVLMIDMNTKQQELETLFDVRIDYSLADILESPIDIHEAIGITSIPNLELLSGGNFKSGINTLLTSAKTSDILNQLREHYDLIVIDTPEAGRFIDAVPMMKMSDISLYVVKANSGSGEEITNAESIRKDYDIDNMFMVLNSIKKKASYTGLVAHRNHKNVKIDESSQIVGEKVSFLRKIALWFY